MTADDPGALTAALLDTDDPLGAYLLDYALLKAPASAGCPVGAEGRGSGTLKAPINGRPVSFCLDFVLLFEAHSLISRFDCNGTGSGTPDLQRRDRRCYALCKCSPPATLMSRLPTGMLHPQKERVGPLFEDRLRRLFRSQGSPRSRSQTRSRPGMSLSFSSNFETTLPGDVVPQPYSRSLIR